MGYELIICEKPSAAKKIAGALADGGPKKENNNGIPYYTLKHKGKDIVIVSAVGHLFSLTEKEKSYKYPSYDIEWKPSYEVNKSANFSKKYTQTIKKLAKSASSFTVACDYDTEGEVIGLNIIKYACKKKDASRMKFSTLTKSDLVKSYASKSKTLDWGQANAGETRHFMDWFFGINLSRALTLSMKAAGNFKVMSTGRVQGPALKLVVDKEKEIKAFIPEDYWMIELTGTINKGKVSSMHELDKIFDKKKANTIFKKVEGQKTAEVVSVKKKEKQVPPPFPFDLTSLQIESHKVLRISPKKTLEIAQELYVRGYTSYPRTSSQQLPKEIGYRKIIGQIAKQNDYKVFAKELLNKKNLTPNNGKKTDPAHPAIYPTGLVPDFKNEYEKKLYDLITKRFLSTFSDPATRETMTVKLDCNKEIFIAKGTTTTTQGWFKIYGKYVMLKENELPKIAENDICKVKRIEKLDKQTTPPKRFTESSLIKKLENEGLGTKATRASIIETLFNRKFVEGKPIVATDLGIKTCDSLNKYCPEIQKVDLTKHFEQEMRKIRENKAKPGKVLKEAKSELDGILKKFKTQEKKIGKELTESYRDTLKQQNTIAKCPNCKKGDLVIKRGKFGRFVGCDNYPDCKTIFNIPKVGSIKSADKQCEQCNMPMVTIQLPKKKPQTICINNQCSSKSQGVKSYPEEGMTCPICNKGKMKLRRSFYGEFLGCSEYPKCKTMMRIVNGKVDINAINTNKKATPKTNSK